MEFRIQCHQSFDCPKALVAWGNKVIIFLNITLVKFYLVLEVYNLSP